MIKTKIILLLFILVSISTFAQKADDIIGKYHLPNKLDVEIYKYEGKYYGKIIALNNFENGQSIDNKNPDKAKQNNLLIGMVIIEGLEYDRENNEWVNGTMYGPEKGMTFNLEITEMREKEIEVVGSKYFFWHTLIWEKLL